MVVVFQEVEERRGGGKRVERKRNFIFIGGYFDGVAKMMFYLPFRTWKNKEEKSWFSTDTFTLEKRTSKKKRKK